MFVSSNDNCIERCGPHGQCVTVCMDCELPKNYRIMERLVAQRVALNERLPEPHCWICENWAACLYDNFKGTCPLGLKEEK